jgi:hypothetical protein
MNPQSLTIVPILWLRWPRLSIKTLVCHSTLISYRHHPVHRRPVPEAKFFPENRLSIFIPQNGMQVYPSSLVNSMSLLSGILQRLARHHPNATGSAPTRTQPHNFKFQKYCHPLPQAFPQIPHQLGDLAVLSAAFGFGQVRSGSWA